MGRMHIFNISNFIPSSKCCQTEPCVIRFFLYYMLLGCSLKLEYIVMCALGKITLQHVSYHRSDMCFVVTVLIDSTDADE